jgi:glycosyltransferase involved in cell wall biosynthesis
MCGDIMLEKLSIVVPCFNEEKMVPCFYQETLIYIKELAINYEIIFVNDGSSDNTWNEIIKLNTLDNNIRAINFSRNFGKEAAMLAGIRSAKGDYVVVMDCDLQHPPYLLPKMYYLLKKEAYDAVGAYRLGRTNNKRNESFLRILYAKIFYKFINKMSNINIKTNATDYRMMKRRVVNALLEINEYNRFSKGLFEWVGFRTTYVGYEDVKRTQGKSSWSFIKLLNYALEGITSFSTVPLKLSGLLGLLCASMSFLYMAYVIIDRIFRGTEVSGWATTVSLILFLGGIMLISLGLLGEYIGRIYNEVKKRPLYIIDEIINNEEDQDDK